MKGSIAVEALLISAIGIYFIVLAGKAVQGYGVKFAEDVDRAILIRQNVLKIYSSVKMLEDLGAGSRDILDVYVPEGGQIDLSGHTISGKIVNMDRNYDALGGSEYHYSMSAGPSFTTSTSIPPGWARIKLTKVGEDINVTVIWTGVGVK